MGMKLAEVYKVLIEKRPDLAVQGLQPPQPYFSNWLLPNGREDDTRENSIAEAMIFDKWLKALPEGHWLDHARSSVSGGGWRVWRPRKNGFDADPVRPSPLEAVEAFHLIP